MSERAALFEAIKQKKTIEEAINHLLDYFNENTGLTVTAIEVNRTEITGFGDDCQQFRFSVKTEVIVP